MGHKYKITKVELVTTAVRGFKGLRVTATDIDSGQECAEMLWLREVAGSQSKLGSFINAFSEFFGDLEKAKVASNWVGHVVHIITWAPRNRSVKVVE